MDCPSEERLVRMRLKTLESVKYVDIDLSSRILEVYHSGSAEQINDSLQGLKLNITLLNSKNASSLPKLTTDKEEEKALKIILVINFTFFIGEVIAGIMIHSMGVIADGLDMLSDSLVYGLSLYAVGKVAITKKNIAKLVAYFQLALASLGIIEVVRRFVNSQETPLFQYMIVISILALIANVTSLLVLRRSKSKEVHIKASEICTSVDVIANTGVIIAAILVYFTGSNYPDLIIGSIIFLMVARGSHQIMQLSK